jgi:hypothetical protein
MELIVVFDRTSPNNKWLIRKNNIGQKYLCGVVDFRDNTNINFFYEASWLNALQLNANKEINEEEWKYTSRILPSDAFRNLNIQEYIKLGNIFKHHRVKYNKKTDEFIKMI